MAEKWKMCRVQFTNKVIFYSPTYWFINMGVDEAAREMFEIDFDSKRGGMKRDNGRDCAIFIELLLQDGWEPYTSNEYGDYFRKRVEE